MKIALYSGSFDPVTLGHLDVIKDGANIFDKLIVAVADNPDKKSMFSVEQRKNFITECVKNMTNVEVDTYTGLTVEYAKRKGADILLRGLRSVSDFEYELQLSQNNRLLEQNIKTVFLMTKPEHSFISSSGVKEVLKNNGDISKYVPSEIIGKIKEM